MISYVSKFNTQHLTKEEKPFDQTFHETFSDAREEEETGVKKM